MSFDPLHVVRSHSLIVERPLAAAFAFFTPEGERAWARGWEPRYFYPLDGRPQPGLVFTTGHGDEHTIWTLLRMESPHLVEYMRTTPASRTGTVLVQCAALGEARTRATVVYSLTALTEDGNKLLRKMDEDAFRATIESWERAIAEALARGATA